MRVIDLLNKLANNEEMPKFIKVCNILFEYYPAIKDYRKENNKSDCFITDFLDNYSDLNKEIEIIEDTPKEDKKIEKLEYYDNSIMWCLNGREITDTEKNLIDKINEIIEKINGE